MAGLVLSRGELHGRANTTTTRVPYSVKGRKSVTSAPKSLLVIDSSRPERLEYTLTADDDSLYLEDVDSISQGGSSGQVLLIERIGNIALSNEGPMQRVSWSTDLSCHECNTYMHKDGTWGNSGRP